jgi:hypothetical protein
MTRTNTDTEHTNTMTRTEPNIPNMDARTATPALTGMGDSVPSCGLETKLRLDDRLRPPVPT